MLFSTRPVIGGLKSAVIAAVFALLLVPGIAGAGSAESSGTSAIVASQPGDADANALGFSDRPCIYKDFYGDKNHHGEAKIEDVVEQATAWENAARQAAEDGDHEKAAGSYKYAACLWDSVSELSKAEAAYEKAAEQYDAAAQDAAKAGDKVKAAEMKKKAEEIRDLLD